MVFRTLVEVKYRVMLAQTNKEELKYAVVRSLYSTQMLQYNLKIAVGDLKVKL